MVRFFSALGAPLLALFQYLGELILLAGDTFRSIFTHRLRWKLFLNQVVEIGLLSQVLVIITGGFTGAVFSAQAFFQFNKLGMGSAVGAVVSVSLCRELAPVLTALMVAGRVGAAMSAEIGTMKVTEQIDALRALAVYPIDYLVVPRTLAMIVSMPLLVAECIAFGIVAGYFVAVYLLDVNGPYYVANMVRWTRPQATLDHGGPGRRQIPIRLRDPLGLCPRHKKSPRRANAVQLSLNGILIFRL